VNWVILFALGLFTRATAVLMAILTLFAHTSYHTHDTNLFLGAILIGYVMFGPRAISIDGLITPGLSDSALPTEMGNWRVDLAEN